ncbi:hypothetical protein [Actinokineospora inagensis]|uniref:hypothetical protein n=1 Tax=Actinokineospora inagensis TaxID=103730 RepID=UPI0012F775BC|nr:hypothetical protein [Actinokineospora inagensis]
MSTATDIPEVDVRGLGPMRLLGSGGQGKVQLLVDHADGQDPLVYKEYSNRVIDEVDVDALRHFVGFAHGLAPSARSALLARLAWPQVVVRKDGVVSGFLMRKAPVEYSTRMRFGSRTTEELALVQYLLNPPAYLADRGLRVTAPFRLEFLHDTAEALAMLHGMGICVGDLSPNNMLFSMTARPRSFFIDCDAMRLAGASVLPQVETPDWQISAVGAEDLATPQSDSYKLGLLAVRVFASDQQSTDLRSVPVRLRAKVTASLSQDPLERPTPRSWVGPLTTALRELPAEPTESPEPTPEPTVPMSRPATQARAKQRRVALWQWAAIPLSLILVAVLAMIFRSSDKPTSGPALPRYQGIYPSYTRQLPSLYVPPMTRLTLPTMDPLPDMPCVFAAVASPDVHGGDGLTKARSAINSLVCEVNAAKFIIRIVLEELAAKGPYDSGGRIIGFWGEGTSTPRATVSLATKAGGCVLATVRFTATYEVSSVAVATC